MNKYNNLVKNIVIIMKIQRWLTILSLDNNYSSKINHFKNSEIYVFPLKLCLTCIVIIYYWFNVLVFLSIRKSLKIML